MDQRGAIPSDRREDNTEPKVTVIIPVYNREDYVEETIRSVLLQTYGNIEIIAVDDGCTDNSRGILDKFGDRIRILEHSGHANRGQSAAINLAMHSSSSEYVAILDSDDVWLPDKIRIQVDFLESNPAVGLVYCNGYAIDSRGSILHDIYAPGHVEKNDLEELLKNCYFLVPNNSLVRRNVFEVAGDFDETLRLDQDHDMAIRVAEITRLAYVDEKVFCYRRHKNSLSYILSTTRMWQNELIILDKARARYPYSRKAIRSREAGINFRLGQCLASEKKYLRSAYHFLVSGILDPVRAVKVLLGVERIWSRPSFEVQK